MMKAENAILRFSAFLWLAAKKQAATKDHKEDQQDQSEDVEG